MPYCEKHGRSSLIAAAKTKHTELYGPRSEWEDEEKYFASLGLFYAAFAEGAGYALERKELP